MDSLTWIATGLAIIAAIAAATMGILVWFGDRGNRSRISFLWVSVFVGVWIASNVLFSINVGQYQYAIALVSYMAAMLTVVQIFVFCLDLVRKGRIKPYNTLLILFGYIAAIFSAIPGVVATGVDNLSIHANSTILTMYGVILLFYIAGSCIVLVKGRHGANMILKQRIKLVSYGIIIAGSIGVFFNLVLPLLNIYSFVLLGPSGAVALVAAVAYSIVKYSLFDVRLVIVRSLGYLLSIVTLALVYFLLAYTVSVLFFKDNTTSGISVNPFNIALSLVLAFAFQPIKRLFDRLTNFLFYRDVYDVEEFFARLTKRLSIITNLDVLLRYSSSEIASTLKASFGAFYIHQIQKTSLYVSTNDSKAIPDKDVHTLDEYVGSSRKEIIITSSLDDKKLKRMLNSYHIALTLPITKDSIVTGYLFLGEHLSSEYTTRDIKALLTIADELVIAIQNALSVQEIRELNDNLQHRVDVATKELRASNAMLRRLDKSKDDFISMASHQLRTPLTSIKGYISMVRDGDVGKITKTQDELLGEAFTSSERMVHLINDFLNVSRLQTGKFLIDKHPVDLAKVVQQELESLTTNAQSRKLSFTYRMPKKFPMLNLDEDKMRQVIMNFSDNAIYYSTEGTKIKVRLAVEGKNVVFTVTDTGIGVPRAEQSQLFNKFYRASNARKQRPDGTGVGLYLAKKVVDAHDGKIIFESVEGKGSTFGFKLPISELRA